jgi:lantibiotic biosynthesis protein
VDATFDASGGRSWPSPLLPTRYNLTDYSHGAAGIAHGLLELYRRTGDLRYLDGAAGAFTYERSVFAPEVRNWPDFRESQGRRRHRRSQEFCSF